MDQYTNPYIHNVAHVPISITNTNHNEHNSEMIQDPTHDNRPPRIVYRGTMSGIARAMEEIRIRQLQESFDDQVVSMDTS
jgi:hypothetical protein